MSDQEPNVYKIGGGWGSHAQFMTREGAIQKRKDGNEWEVWGHQPRRPQNEDVLHAPMKSGKTLVMRFVEVELCRDPPDMFFGWVTPVGYLDVEVDKYGWLLP